MNLSDELLKVIDRRIDVKLRRRRKVTSWGTVTQTSPVRVRLEGDDEGSPVRVADSAPVLSVGDVVGLTRYGSRWYVTVTLRSA